MRARERTPKQARKLERGEIAHLKGDGLLGRKTLTPNYALHYLTGPFFLIEDNWDIYG